MVSHAQTDSTIVLMGSRPAITVPVDMKISNREFNMNRLHHSFCLAVPVATVGLAMMPADHAIRDRVVNGMKYSIGRTRPNGAEGSFPSGHTATAFMGATLLAHEYGHKSVWIPIAGYTVATATGVMRILNNRHYASDVLVGAAIGILSAELAYWASDAIFNDRKLFKSRRASMHYEVLKNY